MCYRKCLFLEIDFPNLFGLLRLSQSLKGKSGADSPLFCVTMDWSTHIDQAPHKPLQPIWSKAGNKNPKERLWVLKSMNTSAVHRDWRASKHGGGWNIYNLSKNFTLHEKHIRETGVHLQMTHWGNPFARLYQPCCHSMSAWSVLLRPLIT